MNDTFLKACRGEKVDYTPVWLMRQAGRYLPEYRAVLEKSDFLTACRTPAIAAELTMQPVNIIGVDAAIFYSDITTTVVPMGMDLRYEKGHGPSYANPVRTRADAERLRVPDDVEEGLGFVYDAQKICARELKVPLIGFAGAPFTVSCYMIEGAGSHSFANTRRMLFADTDTYRMTMDKVTRHTANYLKAQAKAGARALMLFDSHAGTLGPRDYQEFNLPYVKKILAELKSTGVPLIYFGLGAHASLGAIRDSGADVIGVDYGLRLEDAVAELGTGVSVQGNIESNVLFQSREQIRQRVRETLDGGKRARGHVFNLGHGVPQGAPVDHVKVMVDAVHEYSRVA